MYALRDSAEATKALRLEAWREGVRGSSVLVSLVVFAGSLGILRCTWASLVRPWGSLGMSGMSLELLEVSGRSLGVPGKCQGLPRGLWKAFEKHVVFFVSYFHISPKPL